MGWIGYLLIIWITLPSIIFATLGFNFKRTKDKRLRDRQRFSASHQ
jgi:hypothetical protein